MNFFAFTLFAFAYVFASHAVGAPVELEARSNSGYATYFYPGLGAYGIVNGDNDLVMAISPPHFDGQGKCFKPAALSRGNKRVYVTVVDRCTGCAVQNVDLSPAAFKALGNLGKGKIPVVWDFIA
ncbi:DPBB_1 domain-containing protein [Rhizina undulata]